MSASLAEATDEVNRQQVPNLVEVVRAHLPEGGRVGVLGLTYKPDTNVTEESQGMLLVQALRQEDIPVTCYDPGVRFRDTAKEFEGFTSADTLKECIAASDVIVITTPWEEFGEMDPRLFAREGSPRVVIDCWRILDPEKVRVYATYRALGIGYAADNKE